MERTKVKSSNIESIGHNPDNDTLHVEFKGGKVFEYEGVTADEHDKLMNSGSIGSHFFKHVKNCKTCKAI